MKIQIEKNKIELYYNELRRLMLLPKKLNDKTFCKYYDIKINLLDIFLLLIEILNQIYDDKENKKFHEYKLSITNIMVNTFL